MANRKSVGLDAELEDAIYGQDRNAAEVAKVVNEQGGFKKITDKVLLLSTIKAILVSFLGIIIKQSHNITQIPAVCNAIFNNLIFAAEATSTVFY